MQNGNVITSQPNVLNAAQLAKALGISRAGAYNLMNSGGFPTLRIGSRKLVSQHHLNEWIESQVAERKGWGSQSHEQQQSMAGVAVGGSCCSKH